MTFSLLFFAKNAYNYSFLQFGIVWSKSRTHIIFSSRVVVVYSTRPSSCVSSTFSRGLERTTLKRRETTTRVARVHAYEVLLCVRSVGFGWSILSFFALFYLCAFFPRKRERERDLERSDRAKNDTARWRCARRRVGVPREAS